MKHPNLNKKDLISIQEHFQYKSNKISHRYPDITTLYKTGTALKQALTRQEEYEERFPEPQYCQTFEDSDSDQDYT